MENTVKEKWLPQIYEFIKVIPEYKNTKLKRGVVVCAGDDHFISAFILVKSLVDMNPNVNIEWFYVGNELYDFQIKEISKISNVKLIDCLINQPKWFPNKIEDKHLRGYMIKPYSLMMSEFEEIIFIDADNFPLNNPEVLLECNQYKKNGNLFWPDFKFTNNNDMNKMILPQTDKIFSWFNVENPSDKGLRLTESGQMLINKRICWNGLCLAYYMNYNHDFFYQLALGDKDLYYLAFSILKIPYELCKYNPDALGSSDNRKMDSIAQRHPETGNVFFTHRTMSKITHNIFKKPTHWYTCLNCEMDISNGLVTSDNESVCINNVKGDIENKYNELEDHWKDISETYNNNLQNIFNENVNRANGSLVFTNSVQNMFVIQDLANLKRAIKALIKCNGGKDTFTMNIQAIYFIEIGKIKEALDILFEIYKNKNHDISTIKIFVHMYAKLLKTKAFKLKPTLIPTEYLLYLLIIFRYEQLVSTEEYINIMLQTNIPFYRAVGNILKLQNDNLLEEKHLDELLAIEKYPIFPTPVYMNTFYNLSFTDNNNKNIKQKVSELHRKLCPQINYVSNNLAGYHPKKKIKIGFISTNFKNHSVARDRTGIIVGLDRDVYDVTIFYFNKYPNHSYFNILWNSDSNNVMMDNQFDRRIKQIEDERLDILVYCDIGMQEETYLLAHTRLAPIQITTWGHSETSGISTIDYYISSNVYEDENSYDHYSERLLKLNSLCTYYYDSLYEVLKTSETDMNIQMNSGGVYLTCLQYLHKLCDDDIKRLRSILRNTNNFVKIVVINGSKQQSDVDKFSKKFSGEKKDITDRIIILPSLRTGDFYRVIKNSYLILDTYPHGGCNSTLESIHFNKLVITLPSKYLRGRFTQGFYKTMDITDGISSSSNDYVSKVIHYIYNPEELKAIENKIKDKKSMLFNDKLSITEWDYTLMKIYNYHERN